MSKEDLYYKAPKDKVFREVKRACIALWMLNRGQFDKEKTDRIKDLKNISDNFMYMVAMFDMKNQTLLAGVLSKEAKRKISDRLKAGGTPDCFNKFL